MAARLPVCADGAPSAWYLRARFERRVGWVHLADLPQSWSRYHSLDGGVLRTGGRNPEEDDTTTLSQHEPLAWSDDLASLLKDAVGGDLSVREVKQVAGDFAHARWHVVLVIEAADGAHSWGMHAFLQLAGDVDVEGGVMVAGELAGIVKGTTTSDWGKTVGAFSQRVRLRIAKSCTP